MGGFEFKLKTPKILRSVRYTLAAVNGVFLITGIFLLIVGIVVLVQCSEYETLITQTFFTIPRFAIGTGVLIFLTAILGFYGAISEQFYFIAGYVVLLLVVLVFELSIVIVSFGLKNDASSTIRSTMLQSLQLYSSRIEVAKVWDSLQMDFECCGVAGRHDWSSTSIPVSCCHIDFGTVSPFTCGYENAYLTGCSSALGEWLSYNAYVLAVSALLVTCLQIVITSMAGWLAWRSRYDEIELES